MNRGKIAELCGTLFSLFSVSPVAQLMLQNKRGERDKKRGEIRDSLMMRFTIGTNADDNDSTWFFQKPCLQPLYTHILLPIKRTVQL